MADEPKPAQPDVSALQAEIAKLKDRAQSFEAEATHLKKTFEWCKDPEAAKANLSAYEQMRKESTGGDPKKIDAIVAEKEKEIEKRFSSKLSELESQIESSNKELKTLRVTNVAMQEAAKHFNADGLPLLQQVIDASTDFIDGKVVIMQGGKPRASEKDPRNQMEIPEYMEILAKQYPSLAKSEAVSGGKPTGSTYTNGGTRLTVGEYARLSADDQRKYMGALPPAEQRTFLNDLVRSR